MGKIERDLEALARNLGGGWRMEHGVIPVVVLTNVEAERLAARLTAAEGAVEVLRDLLDVTEAQDAEWDTPKQAKQREAIYERARAALGEQ
jgi:hypothetical protein